MKNQINCTSLRLEYPCPWLYKVIGSDLERIRAAIAQVIGDGECTVSHSNSSNTGKYHCLNLEMVVTNEECRNQIYQALQNHPDIRMVL